MGRPGVVLAAGLAVGRFYFRGAARDVVNHTSAPLLSSRKIHTGRIVVALDVAELGTCQIEPGSFAVQNGGHGDIGHRVGVDEVEILIEKDVDFAGTRNGQNFLSSIHKEHPLKNVFEALSDSIKLSVLGTAKEFRGLSLGLV